MLELLFVFAFFVMLLLTGISLLGILAALAVAAVLMAVGGFLAFVIKLFPWLVLALVAVWIYRALRKPELANRDRFIR